MTEKASLARADQRNDPIATKELENAFFDRLRKLARQCSKGGNKHDTAKS